jgi:hypothetical protein
VSEKEKEILKLELLKNTARLIMGSWNTVTSIIKHLLDEIVKMFEIGLGFVSSLIEIFSKFITSLRKVGSELTPTFPQIASIMCFIYFTSKLFSFDSGNLVLPENVVQQSSIIVNFTEHTLDQITSKSSKLVDNILEFEKLKKDNAILSSKYAELKEDFRLSQAREIDYQYKLAKSEIENQFLKDKNVNLEARDCVFSKNQQENYKTMLEVKNSATNGSSLFRLGSIAAYCLEMFIRYFKNKPADATGFTAQDRTRLDAVHLWLRSYTRQFESSFEQYPEQNTETRRGTERRSS